MRTRQRTGFTRTEMLICVGIIAILLGLLLPATRRIREPANRMKCANNFKQILLALHNFHDTASLAAFPSTNTTEADVLLPPGCVGSGKTPEDRLSWLVVLLPYLEQEALAKRFNLTQGYESNQTHTAAPIKVLICPSDGAPLPNAALTNYVAIAGVSLDAATQPLGAVGNGFMGYDRRISFAAIKDGLANTIALMETSTELGRWARGGRATLRGFDPTDVPAIGVGRPFGAHKSGAQVGLADGSCRFLLPTIDPKRLAAAITIAGDESERWE